uniref:Secreted protein n=1 Tax=Bursaphelenchus xylophilus TaxID=6326 RepID=A0A1I7RYY4_BURXY
MIMPSISLFFSFQIPQCALTSRSVNVTDGESGPCLYTSSPLSFMFLLYCVPFPIYGIRIISLSSFE